LNKLDHWPMRILIIVLNTLCWGIAGLYGEGIFQILMVGLLSSCAIAFAFIDLKIHLIPNEMLLGMLALGVLYQTVQYGWKAMGIGLLGLIIAGAAFMILGLIIGLEKIGAGDVKLVAVMVAVLGYPFMLYALLGMSVLLIGYIVIGISIGKLTHVTMFPFAPFMMAGQIFALMMMVLPVTLIG
jgi:leader peptidase (prepilin peptidase) / N-methyltransferase